MTVGVGCEMVEIAGLRDDLATGGMAWREAIYTPAEIAYCETMRYPARHYAARLAAKTALLKALDCSDQAQPAWLQAEVARDDHGRPQLILRGALDDRAKSLSVRHVLVSLTHTRTLAAAQVVLES